VVNATSTVSTEPIGKDFENFNKMTWEQVKDWSKNHRDDNTLDAQQYKFNSPLVVKNQELEMYAERSFLKDRLIVDAVQDLMDRIHRDFTYDPHFTTIATPLLKVLKHRRGVCQDFAHLAIGCLRSIGLASRYVSGYIETKPPEGQKRLVGADASHAWFSVYVPEMGWIDFDPTNNQMPTDQHITVAIGRDFHDVTPLKGVIFGGGEHKLKVSVDVENIDTTPTVTTVDNTTTPPSTLSTLPDKPEPIS
jgi:transglutaminase-like putative cysteine protease